VHLRSIGRSLRRRTDGRCGRFANLLDLTKPAKFLTSSTFRTFPTLFPALALPVQLSYTPLDLPHSPMRKFSLLLGALGGATAGYLFSNKKLREELSSAKDPEEAAKLLGKHLQHDGKKLAQQIQDFVGSEDVQRNVGKAKRFAKQKVDDAKAELDELFQEGKSKAKQSVRRVAKKAKTAARTTGKRVRAQVRKLS